MMFSTVFSHIHCLMSTLNTPTGSPQRDSAVSWKRKYELLEMQCAHREIVKTLTKLDKALSYIY